MKFEWDEKKNLLNIRKHGISFEEAAFVYLIDFFSHQISMHYQ